MSNNPVKKNHNETEDWQESIIDMYEISPEKMELERIAVEEYGRDPWLNERQQPRPTLASDLFVYGMVEAGWSRSDVMDIWFTSDVGAISRVVARAQEALECEPF